MALLLIAGAMASNSLSKIDDSNSILTWDESLLAEPNQEPIAKTDLPVQIKAELACKSSGQLLLPAIMQHFDEKDERQEPHERTIPEASEVRSEAVAQESPFGYSRSVFLLKAMTVLLVMLLAIEAILYLI